MRFYNSFIVFIITIFASSSLLATTTPPATVSTVSPLLQDLNNTIATDNYTQIAQFIKSNFPSQITLSDIQQAAIAKSNIPLQNAVEATKNASLKKIRFSQLNFLLCAWYIEKQLPFDIFNKSYFTKNSLVPADIEYMSKTKNIYIHLPDRVGRGHKKKVYKSIMYTIANSHVVARCMQKGSINSEAKMHIKLGSEPGVMKVFDYSVRKVHGLLTTTLMAKLYNQGDLENVRKKGNILSTRERLQICLQVITGLESIHKAGYIDRDLKPLNILVNITKNLNGTNAKIVEGVITDFGRAIATKKAKHVDAQWPKPNRAPEAVIFKTLRGKDYEKTDIYALGTILYAFMLNKETAPWTDEKLVRSHSIYENQKYKELYSIVENGTKKARSSVIHGTPQAKLSVKQQALLLFIQMSDANPSNRPTAAEAKYKLQQILSF